MLTCPAWTRTGPPGPGRRRRDPAAALRGEGVRSLGGSLAITAAEETDWYPARAALLDAAAPAIGVGAALACDHVAEVVVRPPLGT